tara:strand:+ start:982 stop:1356 length:375 start_codon:yes stop_codon:yes gene_type:complete
MISMVTGKVAFSSVSKTDTYNGQDTGNFSLTVTLDDGDAEILQQKGVRLKEYEGSFQRKFKSKYPVEIINLDDSPYEGEIPRGSDVRVVYSMGPEHPTWGPSTYLGKVRVVLEAEPLNDMTEEF